jgi:polyhydroxyalkanoate synthesis regulator protein
MLIARRNRNRNIYINSKCVNLQELFSLLKNDDVQVIDHVSKEDITHKVLVQLLKWNESFGPQVLDSFRLNEIIREGGFSAYLKREDNDHP